MVEKGSSGGGQFDAVHDAGDVIVRRADNAYSMYFIAGGKVDIQLAGRHISLGVGHFFGEIAVLRRARRSATVTATARANLLVLDAGDFHMLMEHDTRIAERVHAVMRERVGLEAISPKGDIAAGELNRRNRRMIGRGRSVTRGHSCN